MAAAPAAWTIERIEDLLVRGVSENEEFDFKGAKVLSDAEGVSSLSKAVTAFANARGGTIIIGVRDGTERAIEGLKVDTELAKRIHDRIKVYPLPQYPPPVALPWKGGLSVVVLDIPASDQGPHASIADKMPKFYQRTPSGAEPMTWIGIRDGMIRAEDRQRNAEILLGELQQHYLTARSHRDSSYYGNDGFPNTSTFELTLTRNAFASVYPWIARDPHLGPDFARLLSRLNYLNGQVQAMVNEVATHSTRLKPWQSRMSSHMNGLRDQLVGVDAGIRRVFGMPERDYRNYLPENY
ncbi:MAG TPA: ATP-binding protein [Candidatus Thermoplasmatota archaeon]|nr:ATP-binding protein [Candidatus Thermoplasmatota archaeon]